MFIDNIFFSSQNSHLQGIFNRTIRLLECGIKPVYVFDGKPPTLKSGELAKRSERKKEAKVKLEAATEAGDAESAAKLVKQTVTVTQQHNEESKKLLRLLGIPVIEAPSEAEAQCAELCKKGKVWATGTEDMDSLTLGTPILLRHLTMSESRKIPINEITLATVLSGLNFTMDQFIDLCILLGCDYCPSIRGIGPKRAIELITKHKSIEGVIAKLDKTKYPLPEEFPYEEARELFKNPQVVDGDEIELKWSPPDEEALLAYLVGEKNFNEVRVKSGLARIQKGKAKRSQGRVDSFFKKEAPKESDTPKSPPRSSSSRGGRGGGTSARGGRGGAKAATKPGIKVATASSARGSKLTGTKRRR